MLPFLKNKTKNGTGIVERLHRPEDSYKQQQTEETSTDSNDLEICAIDILKAIKTNDIKGLADAIKAAFEICDSQPHVEGEHIGEE